MGLKHSLAAAAFALSPTAFAETPVDTPNVAHQVAAAPDQAKAVKNITGDVNAHAMDVARTPQNMFAELMNTFSDVPPIQEDPSRVGKQVDALVSGTEKNWSVDVTFYSDKTGNIGKRYVAVMLSGQYQGIHFLTANNKFVLYSGGELPVLEEGSLAGTKTFNLIKGFDNTSGILTGAKVITGTQIKGEQVVTYQQVLNMPSVSMVTPKVAGNAANKSIAAQLNLASLGNKKIELDPRGCTWDNLCFSLQTGGGWLPVDHPDRKPYYAGLASSAPQTISFLSGSIAKSLAGATASMSVKEVEDDEKARQVINQQVATLEASAPDVTVQPAVGGGVTFTPSLPSGATISDKYTISGVDASSVSLKDGQFIIKTQGNEGKTITISGTFMLNGKPISFTQIVTIEKKTDTEAPVISNLVIDSKTVSLDTPQVISTFNTTVEISLLAKDNSGEQPLVNFFYKREGAKEDLKVLLMPLINGKNSLIFDRNKIGGVGTYEVYPQAFDANNNPSKSTILKIQFKEQPPVIVEPPYTPPSQPTDLPPVAVDTPDSVPASSGANFIAFNLASLATKMGYIDNTPAPNTPPTSATLTIPSNLVVKVNSIPVTTGSVTINSTDAVQVSSNVPGLQQLGVVFKNTLPGAIHYLNINVLDTIVPTMSVSSVSKITSISAEYKAESTKKGKVFWALLPVAAPAPNVAQIKAGTDGAGAAAGAGFSGNVNVLANTAVTIALSGLSPTTQSVMYSVAEDEAIPAPNPSAISTTNIDTLAAPAFDAIPTISAEPGQPIAVKIHMPGLYARFKKTPIDDAATKADIIAAITTNGTVGGATWATVVIGDINLDSNSPDYETFIIKGTARGTESVTDTVQVSLNLPYGEGTITTSTTVETLIPLVFDTITPPASVVPGETKTFTVTAPALFTKFPTSAAALAACSLVYATGGNNGAVTWGSTYFGSPSDFAAGLISNDYTGTGSAVDATDIGAMLCTDAFGNNYKIGGIPFAKTAI